MRKYLSLFSFLLLAGAASSQSIKMKITNVTDAAGEEVLAIQVSDTAFFGTGGTGGASGTIRFEPFKMKKPQGKSTNELFKRSVMGTHTPEVTFEFYDAGAAMYYKIVLRDVTISHFSLLSPECSGCSKLFHQVWMEYRKIELTDVVNGTTIRYDVAAKAIY